MDDNLAILLIMVVAIAAAVRLTLVSRGMRVERPAAGSSTGEAASPAGENEHLKGQVVRLEERLAALEGIATDPAQRTAREIENLR